MKTSIADNNTAPASPITGHIYRRAASTALHGFPAVPALTKAQEETRAPKARSGDNYQKDVRQVRNDLMEQIRVPGAYCQDYDTFKSIYRFLERGIIRGGQKSCVILLSVTDEEGRSIAPDKKDRLMERLESLKVSFWTAFRL